MADTKRTSTPKAQKLPKVRRVPVTPTPHISGPAYASVLEEARRTGLLDGDKSEHVSFRAPPALVEAAKREAGVTSVSELGVLALAILAQPDPVATFFRRTEGQLGPDHELEF